MRTEKARIAPVDNLLLDVEEKDKSQGEFKYLVISWVV